MTIKAEIAEVQIGPFVIDGLMSANGDFGVAVPQIAERFQFDKRQATRALKPMLGEGFQFHKWRTELNPKAVNVITLDDFHKVVRGLDKKGNTTATMLVDELFGLSLHQLFCDAFGIKFEAEDRQQWLVTRMATRKEFRPLTDQLKAFGFAHPQEYAKFVWTFQSKLGIESGTRDTLPVETLVKLQGAQFRLTAFMECGLSPWQALEKL